MEKLAEALAESFMLEYPDVTVNAEFVGSTAGVEAVIFGTVWKPTAQKPQFGICYVVLTSIVGTFFAMLLGVPIALLTAIFLAEVAPKRLAVVARPAVELLAGIPSVMYGLLGIYILSGALGMGATKWNMIRTILLPSALPGILTGVILAVGRIVGESAALLFTAGSGYMLPRFKEGLGEDLSVYGVNFT